MRRTVIEFRNGSYFGGGELEHGVGIDNAKRFDSRRAAERYMRRHAWIAFHGGMVVSVDEKETARVCRACDGDGILAMEPGDPSLDRVTRDSRRCNFCGGSGTVSS
jgi:hypothetical protein